MQQPGGRLFGPRERREAARRLLRRLLQHDGAREPPRRLPRRRHLQRRLLGLLAHQRTTNYPHRPGAARRRGGLTCERLFGGAGKSLVVDDPRYVYHDVEGGRWFGAYHRANESFLFVNVRE